MEMVFPVGGNGGDFKTLESGSYAAVCDMVANLGIQPGSQLYPAPKRKVYIRFQVPSERTDDDRPMVIGATLTASMNGKAVLRKLLEGWRGKALTDDEAAKFDVSTLLGKPALISVVSKDTDGKTRANIQSVSRLPKGMPTPALEGEAVIFFNSDSKADDAAFEKLPNWLKEKIRGQIAPDPVTVPASKKGVGASFDDDAEIPF